MMLGGAAAGSVTSPGTGASLDMGSTGGVFGAPPPPPSLQSRTTKVVAPSTGAVASPSASSSSLASSSEVHNDNDDHYHHLDDKSWAVEPVEAVHHLVQALRSLQLAAYSVKGAISGSQVRVSQSCTLYSVWALCVCVASRYG